MGFGSKNGGIWGEKVEFRAVNEGLGDEKVAFWGKEVGFWG